MRDLFFKDFWWKLLSLFLAGLIWYTVHKIIEEPKAAEVPPAYVPVAYGDVPVAVLSAAADMRSYGLNSNTVSVNVSGAPEIMAVLQKNQIHATVDLSDFETNSKELYRPVDVTVPWGVTVVKVAPARVKVVPPEKPPAK